MIHIGKRIREVLDSQGRTVKWFAAQIPCDRTNVYSIFNRETLETSLLQRICYILHHDFFKDLSDDTFNEEAHNDKK